MREKRRHLLKDLELVDSVGTQAEANLELVDPDYTQPKVVVEGQL